MSFLHQGPKIKKHGFDKSLGVNLLQLGDLPPLKSLNRELDHLSVVDDVRKQNHTISVSPSEQLSFPSFLHPNSTAIVHEDHEEHEIGQRNIERHDGDQGKPQI